MRKTMRTKHFRSNDTRKVTKSVIIAGKKNTGKHRGKEEGRGRRSNRVLQALRSMGNHTPGSAKESFMQQGSHTAAIFHQ